MGIRYTLRKATQSLRFSSVIPACGNDWTTVFMIHKRELSDSMIESGSSLFYCVPHHQQNPDRVFRSAGFSIHFQNIPFYYTLIFSFISTRYTPKASDTRPALRSGKSASPHRKRPPSFRRSRACFRACFRRMKAPVLPSRFSDTFPTDSGFRFHSAFCR